MSTHLKDEGLIPITYYIQIQFKIVYTYCILYSYILHVTCD